METTLDALERLVRPSHESSIEPERHSGNFFAYVEDGNCFFQASGPKSVQVLFSTHHRLQSEGARPEQGLRHSLALGVLYEC